MNAKKFISALEYLWLNASPENDEIANEIVQLSEIVNVSCIDLNEDLEAIEALQEFFDKFSKIISLEDLKWKQ